MVARSVGMFLTVHQQKAEPAAAYMAAVPFGFDASSPSCVRSVQGPIAPSACGVRRPNANPDHRDGAAPAAAARAARVRRRGKEARVQEAHTRMTTEHRSARRRIRQRRSIASVTASVDMAHRGLLKLVRRTPTTHAWGCRSEPHSEIGVLQLRSRRESAMALAASNPELRVDFDAEEDVL